MLLATPTSAMHPPSAAEMVAPLLYSMPMAEAVKRNVLMSRSGSSEMNSCKGQRSKSMLRQKSQRGRASRTITYFRTAGMTPDAPV